MQCSDPRRGSLCLPTGPEDWRLVLVPLALMLGAAAGLWFYVGFGQAAQAITVGLTTADITMQLVELLLTATAPVGIGTNATEQPSTASHTSLLPLIASVVMGTATGSAFYVVFTEVSEAIAMGVTTTSVALRVVELLIRPVSVRISSGARMLKARVKELADTVRDFIDRFFGGLGGPASCAVRAA
ncbi:hypothetical protein [Streptomyces sp. NBC_00564]|uniref:hypothetical protein n=1 Tax=Streptomyces sp. NBC_00564 TaxID=2903663 RepID=UPI002FCD9B43|nr:hypothetical protein OG256_46060 [Streptomyces sp. NBC_00564]